MSNHSSDFSILSNVNDELNSVCFDTDFFSNILFSFMIWKYRECPQAVVCAVCSAYLAACAYLYKNAQAPIQHVFQN